MKSKPNLILVGICTLLVAAGVYWYFFTGTDNEPPLTMVAPGSGAQARFQTLFAELAPITFDTRIFSDPRFLALVDITTPVAPEAQGRTDPFAPLGVGGSSRATSTTPTATPAARP